MFLLGFAAAAGLVATLTLSAWYEIPTHKIVLGFFGFGVATLACGAATATLWDGFGALQKTLGWTATIIGIGCGALVVLGIAGLVFSKEFEPTGLLIGRLVGLGVTSGTCIGFGIGMLYKAEGKSL